VPRLPAPPAPAFRVRAVPEQAARTTYRWAPLLHAVRVRVAPSAGARVVALLPARTPEDTSNLVLVVGRRIDALGRVWVRAHLPVLPNNTTGWLPRTSLGGYGVVHTRLVVDLHALTATLLRDGRPVFRAPIGVGTDASPTPSGQFYVRNRLTSLSSFYGPLAFGTSARSAVLTDWPDGGFIGIHGTDRPDLIPGRISHGCVRLRNQDIVRLGRLMPVGTPVTIR
jgi:L,D-transpeptidase catalytic domain